MTLLRKIFYVAGLIIICSIANAEVFMVKNIRVNGLQRISLGTVLSHLHDVIKEGDTVDTSDTADIIRVLYETKFFSDVSLKRNNNDLVITVVERSVIGSINVSGNSKITKKQLTDALKSVEIAEGRPLDPAVLNAMQHAIIHEYYNMGLYDPKVNIDIKPEERNRTTVTIRIHEGPAAKIRSIKITGNKAFKENTLLKEFFLTTSKFWSFLTHSDQYSKEKLEADLEKLRSYYMDRGYLHIKIDTPKVTITPDKKNIYITINVTEGNVYRLGGVTIEGNLIGKRNEVLKSITLRAGSIFSLKDIIETQTKIKLFLGDNGYGMADVRIDDHDVDENNRKIKIKFIVTPGHRVYIRNISFKGNHKTNDEVLRREMRFQEGSLFSLSKINESTRRLANLGYLQDIEHKITPVADSNNQVDIAYEVKETSAISIGLQGGYSDRDGFLYGANISDQNIFGTGKTVSVSFDNTKATQYYALGYRDPYFTVNNIGFSINGYIRKIDPKKISGGLSGYTSSVYGILASFDMPLSDYSRAGLGFGIEHYGIERGDNRNPNKKVEDFLNQNGKSFNQLKVTTSWSYSNFDRAIFPTSGFTHSVGAELYGPLNQSSLEFYKVDYNATWYRPLFKDFIFRANTELGYGDGFGKTKGLFFLKNYYAGGIGTIRGFEADSICNEQSNQNNNVGGNILALASAGVIIPTPFKDIIRPSIFVDAGSVYDNYFKFSDVRVSYGIQIEWRTPLNLPLIFSFAKPLSSRKKAWDRGDVFQFSFGVSV